jgi:hypothetical protein
MAPSVLAGTPDEITREDLRVLQQTTKDDLTHIEAAWPAFERLVGLKGRKMYASVDVRSGTYTVCTPVRADDPDDLFGLEVGTLCGGRYLRGRILGEPPESFARVGAGMHELVESVTTDATRPLIEFYKRHDVIELWVPITRTARDAA